jgi:hypothetical protein
VGGSEEPKRSLGTNGVNDAPKAGPGASRNRDHPITYTAPSSAGSAALSAAIRGEKCTINFGVLEPTGIDHADVVERFHYGQGVSGAGMHIIVYLAPTTVSFNGVTCLEVGQDASGVGGYYTHWTAAQLGHTTARGANTPIPVGCDNSWDANWDQAFWTDNPLTPWENGDFTWQIPGKWYVGSGQMHDIHFSDQTFHLGSDGTMTVTKFGHSVTRTTSDVISGN